MPVDVLEKILPYTYRETLQTLPLAPLTPKPISSKVERGEPIAPSPVEPVEPPPPEPPVVPPMPEYLRLPKQTEELRMFEYLKGTPFGKRIGAGIERAIRPIIPWEKFPNFAKKITDISADYEQYKKDFGDKALSPDDWLSYQKGKYLKPEDEEAFRVFYEITAPTLADVAIFGSPLLKAGVKLGIRGVRAGVRELAPVAREFVTSEVGAIGKPTPKGKKLLSPQQISDFRVGIDKVVREGNRTFVIDTEGVRKKIEVQSDVMTPEFAANLAKLTPEQNIKMMETIKTTPYLSNEGRAERLAVIKAEAPVARPVAKEVPPTVSPTEAVTFKKGETTISGTFGKPAIERPARIGNARIILEDTESRISALKVNLIRSGRITEESYRQTMENLGLKTDRFESAKRFITERQGRQLLRDLNFEAEIGLIERDTKLAQSLSPEIGDAIGGVSKNIQKQFANFQGGKPAQITPWEDIRYYYQGLQAKTGGRFYDVFEPMFNKWSELDTVHAQLMEKIAKSTPAFSKIAGDEKALQRITAHIASKNKMYKIKPPVLNADEKVLSDTLEEVLFGFRNDVRFYRFKRSYFAHSEEADWLKMLKKEIPDATTADLRKAAKIYETEGADGLRQFLDTKTWGVIETGYEPHSVVNPRLFLARLRRTVLPKGHLQTREGIEFLPQDKNILQRINTYAKQMLNLQLEPYIRKLDKIYSETAPGMKDPSKVGRELTLALNNMKGYVEGGGPLLGIFRRLASQAYRTIFFDPALAFRNLFQNVAMHPDRTAFIDLRNRALTTDELDYYRIYVKQTEGIRDWLLRKEKGLPGLGRLNRLAETLTLYEKSDEATRLPSFWASLNKAERAIKEYSKTPNVSELLKASGANELTPLQQKYALETLALEKTGNDFIRYVAREITNNVNFVYKRALRAPAEMGAAARTLGSLITFPRQFAQRMLLQLQTLRTPATSGAKARAMKIVIGNILFGVALGEGYRRITGSKYSPYNPLNMLTWSPGGLVFGAAEAIGNVIDDTVLAVQNDEDALMRLPKSLTRAGDMFLPLYKQTLNVLETLQNTKFVDREALRKVIALFKEEYEPNEEYYQRERDAWEKWQHAIFGAANEPVSEIKPPSSIESWAEEMRRGRQKRQKSEGRAGISAWAEGMRKSRSRR